MSQRFKLFTPGSLLGTVAWFLATWGLSEYAAFIFLLGGEVNLIFESRARANCAVPDREQPIVLPGL